MWQKIKDQLPTIIITAVLVIGAALWMQDHTVKVINAQEDAKLAPSTRTSRCPESSIRRQSSRARIYKQATQGRYFKT